MLLESQAKQEFSSVTCEKRKMIQGNVVVDFFFFFFFVCVCFFFFCVCVFFFCFVFFLYMYSVFKVKIIEQQ